MNKKKSKVYFSNGWVVVESSTGINRAILYGSDHRFTNTNEIKKHAGEIREGETVLVEANSLRLARQLLDNKASEDDVWQRGEQTYFAWIALKKKATVKSWDLDPTEWIPQLRENGFRDEDIAIWLTSLAGERYLQRSASICVGPEDVKQIINDILGLSSKYFLKIDFSFNAKAIDIYFINNFKKPLEKFSLTELNSLHNPLTDLPIGSNKVAQTLNVYRDKQAVEKIVDSLSKNKVTRVFGGRSHVIAWQESLSKLQA